MEVRETAATAIPVASHEPNLSLCMIVRDSSRTLRPCLESARPWVDEIILVDTGSTDETPRIAEEAGAAVRYFQWCDDFAAARNESLKTARGRWLFWMDADDTISPENGRKLRELVSQPHPSEMLGFVLQVHCPAGQGPYSTATVVDHVKVFRNDPQIRFSGRIHEQVLPAIRGLGGDVGWTDIFVTHSGSDHSAEGRARKQKRDLRILQLELGEDPDHTFTLFNMGMTLLDMGRAGDALSPLCQSLQLASPGDSHMRKIYALLAQAYAELGRPQTALKTCIQGLEVCPGDAELLFRCGTLRQQLGQLDTAEECFRAVIEPKRDRYFCSVDRGILGIKAWHNLAVLYDQRQQFDRAAQAWLRVLDYDHSNRSAWHGLLESFTAGNDAAGLQRLCELAPDGQVPRETRLLARARLVTQGGNPAAAVAELERAANEDPSGELLNELCELAFKHEMLDVAERGLVELTRRSPEDASACHNLALVRLRRGDHAEAARWARRSLELRPNYAPSRHLLEDATRAQRSNGAPDAEPAAINVSIGDSLIGDALFTEPAVRALAAALQRRIPLLLHGTPRALFLNHPSVSLVSSEAEATGRWIHIDPVTALAFARPHRCHICCGFFPQLGLDPQGADVKPRLWREGLEPGNRPSRAQRNARIALAPFSASCLGHRTGVPNKTIALEWWNELVRKLPLPADSFGAAHEPPLECAENLRGLPLDEVSGWLRRYELLITTDNGICAIAGALNCDIVLLESASAPWLTGPQTEGRFEVVYSGVPPAWAHGDVVAAVKRILDTAVVSAAQELA
jgi:tetratricopeptide (TPR) repeat protein